MGLCVRLCVMVFCILWIYDVLKKTKLWRLMQLGLDPEEEGEDSIGVVLS